MTEKGRDAAGPDESIDAIIVGAGFAGLYMHYRLRRLGLVTMGFEAGGDVGGTWYWNRYPGARCDVESMQYCYSFSDELTEEWSWSERYAAQPEILRYIEHVAQRFDLKRDIRFSTRVISAAFDDGSSTWNVTTDRGSVVRARFIVMATGNLSAARTPDIPGLSDFAGAIYHTGRWPATEVDFSGARVGVVGTGSSAIQAIPHIAKQAAELVVFQRTPNFSVPARNMPLSDQEVRAWKSKHREIRATMRKVRSGALLEFNDQSALAVSNETREAEYQRRWDKGGPSFLYAFNDLMRSEEANATAADFVREKICRIVTDRATARALTPTDHPLGGKRICVDTNYFETFNRDNVRLVNVREALIERIEAAGVRAGGALHRLDSIVFATGYDAMTGALLAIDIRGESGQSLREKWAHGPRAYLGLMSAGFPNLFFVTGPGSPSVLGNVLVSIEQHVDWIADCIETMTKNGAHAISAEIAAEDDWVAHVNELASGTLYPRASSWYMGANIPGKPRIFMPYVGGIGPYRERCDAVVASGYAGFAFSPRATPSKLAAAE